MNGYGVVLGGGGAKGSYEIGVWKALRELEIPIVAVAGTSVGALNGAIMIQDDFELAYDFWCNIEIQQLINLSCTSILDGKPFTPRELAQVVGEIIENGGIDVTPLKEILKKYVDEAKIRASDVDFGLVTFSLTNLKPEIAYKADIPEGQLVDYLLASSCFPIFKPQEIGSCKYIDGGIYDNLPAALLADKGIKNIIIVDVSGIGRVRRFKRDGLNIISIKNSEFLGKTFQFDGATSKRNITLGYLDALKAFRQLEGKRFYIRKDLSSTHLTYPLTASELQNLDIALDLKNNTLSPDKLANYNIIRTLYRYTDGKLDTQAIVFAAAEISAELMGIDRLNSYGWDELAKEVLKSYKTISESPLFRESLKDISRLVRHKNEAEIEMLDSRLIVAYLTNFAETDKRLIKLRKYITLFFPKICIANLFISLLIKRTI